MRHAKHDYHQDCILQPADDAIVPDAISPELTQFSPQRLAATSWIRFALDPLIKESQNAHLRGTVESLEFAKSARLKSYGPGQGA